MQTFDKNKSCQNGANVGKICKTELLNAISKIKMIDFDNVRNENKTENNPIWQHILNHAYRILIIGGSGSGKTNALSNLINHQYW